MISKIIFAVSLISGFGIFWMLNFTSPSNIGPLGVLGFFGLLYVLIFCVLTLFLFSTDRILGMVFSNLGRKNPMGDRSVVFYGKYMLVVAFSAVVIFAQQSVGGVGIFELILIVILSIIACVFVSKR